MKALYWILGTAILLIMIENMTQQAANGNCEPPQISRVLK